MALPAIHPVMRVFISFLLFTLAASAAIVVYGPRAIPLLSEQNWLVLDRISMLLGYLCSLLFLFGLVDLARPAGWLRRTLARRLPFADPETEQIRASTQGFVLFAHNAELCKTLLDKIEPTHVALVYADKLELEKIKTMIRARADPIAIVHESRTHSAEIAGVSKRAALLAVDALLHQLDAQEIAVDITVGSKPITVGLFMAAEERGVASVYLASDWTGGVRSTDTKKQRLVYVSKGSQ
jgi:hypothetical protein